MPASTSQLVVIEINARWALSGSARMTQTPVGGLSPPGGPAGLAIVVRVGNENDDAFGARGVCVNDAAKLRGERLCLIDMQSQ